MNVKNDLFLFETYYITLGGVAMKWFKKERHSILVRKEDLEAILKLLSVSGVQYNFKVKTKIPWHPIINKIIIILNLSTYFPNSLQ